MPLALGARRERTGPKGKQVEGMTGGAESGGKWLRDKSYVRQCQATKASERVVVVLPVGCLVRWCYCAKSGCLRGPGTHPSGPCRGCNEKKPRQQMPTGCRKVTIAS